MKAIIDPVMGTAMCSHCRAIYLRWDHADECCTSAVAKPARYMLGFRSWFRRKGKKRT